MIRVVAYILRFVKSANSKQKQRQRDNLTPEETKKAIKVLLREVQRQEFSEELRALRKGKPLKHDSRILQLNPFIDDEDIIRVGGRITNSTFAYDMKHPILLPQAHHMTRLNIENEHKKLLHAGPQATLAAIRNEYYPLNGRNTVRLILRKCIRCFKIKPTRTITQMGNLPTARITPT